MISFIALDFETASHDRGSACSVGVAAGRNGQVHVVRNYLIRPPSPVFAFTGIHGLTWEDVRGAPTFGELWPTLRTWFDGADFVAAHNVAFDRSVLRACCAASGVEPPPVPYVCTVQLARSQWNIYPTRLPDVCRRLGIPLHHHRSASDAEACARIVLTAEREGWHHRSEGR
ncbi:MAG: 3'-5' exonuclease [Acidobacteriota bacterium]|nr:3'-5' exonuclease [Acidobacteriota bacterium]